MRVCDLMREMFPNGTRPREGEEPSWVEIPVWAPDVFAFAATLVAETDAYLTVTPDPDDDSGANSPICDYVASPEFRLAALAFRWGLFAFAQEPSGMQWTNHVRILQNYYDTGKTPIDQEDLLGFDRERINELWRQLEKCDETIQPAHVAVSDAWRDAALKLMLIADEAAEGLGFWPRQRRGQNWLQGTLLRELEQREDLEQKDADGGDDYVERRLFSSCTSELFEAGPSPLGFALKVISGHRCAVLPKTRTSTVGCSMRSMTHHLALLPPTHRLDARWRMSPFQPILADVGKDRAAGSVAKNLNLLVVPYPFQIPLKSFKAKPRGSKWGYFEIAQKWLPETDKGYRDFAGFIRDMVEIAEQSIGEVHGIVFPEFALNGRAFQEVADEVRPKITRKGEVTNNLEFILAGVSERRNNYDDNDEVARHGNYVQFIGLHRSAEDGKPRKRPGKDEAGWTYRSVRAKHHRWKIEDRQIAKYGLSSRLERGTSWWEAMPLEQRVIEFIEFRAGNCMTALICEDLARADPVQHVVRSVGPNLVIALLMDGPQRGSRWPGHYAGVLADDPGCSTLTVTSLGLVDRAAGTDGGQNRAVAFFKNCAGEQFEMTLPPGAQALAISLRASSKEEHTLDQRGDGNHAYIWHLNEVCPVWLPA